MSKLFGFSITNPKKAATLASLALLAGCFVLVNQPRVSAANPQIIPFQGKVVNADGTNVSNGTYSFDFVLYDDASLGTPSDGVHDKWHELSKSVAVTNGVFQTNLGSATALPDFNSNPSLYLAIRFNSDAAGYMTPRIQMGSVPYALNADSLGGLSKASFVQLAQGAQSDSSTTNPSIFVNKTNVSGSPNILQLQKAGSDVFVVDNSGTALFKNNSAAGFQLQDASNSKTIFGVDTSGDQVMLGQQGASGINGKLVFNTTNASNTSVTLQAASTGSSYSLTLPTTGPSTSQCLQTDSAVASTLIFASCSAAGGDNVQVNGSNANDINLLDITASGTQTGVTWTLNTAPNPDTISLGIGNASATVAGAVTTGAQTFAGDKTFNGQIVVSNLGTEYTESDTNPTCSTGNYTIYADTSDAKLKKCQNGVVSDLAQDNDVHNRAKSADQSVTNSTTLTDETALQFSIPASEQWNVFWNLIVTNNSSATPDWKSAVVGPTGSTCSMLLFGAEPSAVFPQATGTDCTTPGTLVNPTIASDGGNGFNVNILGTITSGGTAGTVKMQFAENTAGAGTSITIKKGSIMNAYRVTGADLGEIYYTKELLRPGDVVSLDPALEGGVKKSAVAYDDNVIGIISTKPGMVLGGTGNATSSYPAIVALAGRVPVTVSTEGGQINAGDILVPSSIPGVAMKATKPGQSIGVAMNSYNGAGLGMVTAFIKNGYNVPKTGSSVSAVQQNNDLLSQIASADNQTNVELSADELGSIGSSIPSITTGSMPSLPNSIQPDTKITKNYSTPSSTVIPAIKGSIPSLKITDGLNVGGSAEFHGNVIFYKLVSFIEKTVFGNDVTFAGHILTDGSNPTVSSPTGAQVQIDGNDNTGQISAITAADSTSGSLAEVVFSRAYAKAPKVSLTAANADATNAKYYVESTQEGFRVILTDSPDAGTTLKFNYLAVQ